MICSLAWTGSVPAVISYDDKFTILMLTIPHYISLTLGYSLSAVTLLPLCWYHQFPISRHLTPNTTHAPQTRERAVAKSARRVVFMIINRNVSTLHNTSGRVGWPSLHSRPNCLVQLWIYPNRLIWPRTLLTSLCTPDTQTSQPRKEIIKQSCVRIRRNLAEERHLRKFNF